MRKLKTFVDLFAGIGGFHLGLSDHGLKCVFASELDPETREVYRQNFGIFPYGDIKQIKEESIPDHDVLTGGFPCQSFSLAGYQKGENDHRGQLYLEIVRIAKLRKPKVIFLENVANIATMAHRTFFKKFLKCFTDMGYDINYKVMLGSDYGIPQTRPRCYFVFLLKSEKLKFSFPKPQKKIVSICDILDPIARFDPEIPHYFGDWEIIEKDDQKRKRGCFWIGKTTHSYVTRSRIGSVFGASATLTCRRVDSWILDQDILRGFSAKEKKRLDSFPDDHYISPGFKGHIQLGNMAMPRMISQIFSRIS